MHTDQNDWDGNTLLQFLKRAMLLIFLGFGLILETIDSVDVAEKS